jgi:hypothetical protein
MGYFFATRSILASMLIRYPSCRRSPVRGVLGSAVCLHLIAEDEPMVLKSQYQFSNIIQSRGLSSRAVAEVRPREYERK